MGKKRSIPVYLCEFVSSPMMIGVVKPRILLPKLDYTEDELYFILKHELTHYKRHDLIYRYLVLLVTALHWFNPIVYFAAKHIHNLCETSCDEEVLKSTSMDKRRSYCETIFAMAQKQSKLKTVLSTCFCFNKKSVRRRIMSIMDTQKKKTGSAVFLVILFIILGTGCVTASTSTPPDAEDPPEIIQTNNEQPETTYPHDNDNDNDNDDDETIAEIPSNITRTSNEQPGTIYSPVTETVVIGIYTDSDSTAQDIKMTEAILYTENADRPIVNIVNNAMIDATDAIIDLALHIGTDTAIMTVTTEAESYTVTLVVIEDRSSGTIYLQPLDDE
jgi:hypothetical protein